MISVIIPTYNMRTTIEKTIRSVINQTVEPKIFVVDDGSNDGTMEVVSRYREITSLSYPENIGMSSCCKSDIRPCRYRTLYSSRCR